jgi:uncharacterized membrane protein YjgN (DUF898 family)
MIALATHELTADWTAAKWLLWIALYLTLGVFVPWVMTRAWTHQHRSSIRPQVRQLFQNGELGLVGLMLAISVIWDLQKSHYMSYTIALGSVFLILTGIMSGAVWIESYCRRSTGTRFSPERAWRDSRSLALLVFSMSVVTEILLDRFVQAAAL